jgi:hypothetical protein
MVAIPMAMAAISGLVSTYSAYQDANSQNAQADYNAAAYAQNAQLSVEEARYPKFNRFLLKTAQKQVFAALIY